MAALSLYWHTLRHLRPEQIYGRFWFRFSAPRVDLRSAPPLREVLVSRWAQPAPRRPSLLSPESFIFLNDVRSLAEHGWDDPALEKLWRYNLHYFDDLNAFEAKARTEWQYALLLRWIRENPAGVGTGWEPYPTSLRIVNWIKWALAGNALPQECVESLAVQARWLAGRMEWHLLGNHLFANAKALMFAGCFFRGDEADVWLGQAFRVLDRQIPEQILEDGGHFERSTMYHALALEDMLDLCNITAVYSEAVPSRSRAEAQRWRLQVQPMRRWLAAMCHPDGEIAFFNDASIGISPSPFELNEYAARLGFPATAAGEDLVVLSDSGYIRMRTDRAVALLDVAPVGPDYLPAHAHADTLSFELSLFEQRVVVNSGTSCYGASAERLRQRGTAAHNTVVVDGFDSSEVWGGFRVARRARPVDLQFATNPSIHVRCAHDGYGRLPGRPVHQRAWALRQQELLIEDRLSGSYRSAQARFHLHPSIAVERKSESMIVLRLPKQQRVQFSVDGAALNIESSTWHAEFGKSEPNVCIAATFLQNAVRTRITWAGEP